MTPAEDLAYRILSAPLIKEPWPHILLQPALSADLYDRLMHRPVKLSKRLKSREIEPLMPGDEWHDLLASPEVTGALEKKLGFRGEPAPRIVKDPEGSRGEGIHTDAVTKVGTLQIYMTDETIDGHGTKLWNRGGNYLVSTVPFAPNTGYAFARQDYTWHSFGPMSVDRWSLLCPYFNPKMK